MITKIEVNLFDVFTNLNRDDKIKFIRKIVELEVVNEHLTELYQLEEESKTKKNFILILPKYLDKVKQLKYKYHLKIEVKNIFSGKYLICIEYDYSDIENMLLFAKEIEFEVVDNSFITNSDLKDLKQSKYFNYV
jgi:hypothetical protein